MKLRWVVGCAILSACAKEAVPVGLAHHCLDCPDVGAAWDSPADGSNDAGTPSPDGARGSDVAPAADRAGVPGADGGGFACGRTWCTAAPLPLARTEVAAAAAGGKIFALGGLAGVGETDRVDVYDPTQNVWSSGPPLPGDAPRHHLMVASVDGRVYLVGGYRGLGFTAVARAYRLDPGTGWSDVASPPRARGAGGAAVIRGRIYVAGGAGPGGLPPAIDEYDPGANRWSTLDATLGVPREHLGVGAVGDFLVVALGRTAAAGNLRTTEHALFGAGQFTRGADGPSARGGVGAAALRGRLHVLGGEQFGGPGPSTFDEHEAYDPALDRWEALDPMPTRRHGLAVVAHAGRIHAIGGGPEAGFTETDVHEVWTPR